MNLSLGSDPLPHRSVEQDQLGSVLTPGDTRAGTYRVDLTTHEWWWSDETYRIHGFEPGEVVPTSAMVLAHKHPADRENVRHVLDEAQRTGEPFASVHRIIDAHGKNHVVSFVGRGRRDHDGDPVELVGHILDLTASVKRIAAEQADDSIRAAARSRRDIEQAKLLVSLALGVDDDEAFALLRRRSNDTNVPVRVLADQLVQHARATSRPDRPFDPSLALRCFRDPHLAA